MDRDERLGRLADEVDQALAAAETVDVQALAQRFEVDADEAARVVAALRAVRGSLEEDLPAEPALAPPQRRKKKTKRARWTPQAATPERWWRSAQRARWPR